MLRQGLYALYGRRGEADKVLPASDKTIRPLSRVSLVEQDNEQLPIENSSGKSLPTSLYDGPRQTFAFRQGEKQTRFPITASYFRLV